MTEAVTKAMQKQTSYFNHTKSQRAHSPRSVWTSWPLQETTGWSWGCIAPHCSALWCRLSLRQSKSCPGRPHSQGASSWFPWETPCASGSLVGCSVPLRRRERSKGERSLIMITLNILTMNKPCSGQTAEGDL